MFSQMMKKPMRPILRILTAMAMLFVLAALTATIAWIYYIAKAVEQNEIGGSNGLGDDGISGSALETSTAMFQATVVSVFLYFVARHHYNCHY